MPHLVVVLSSESVKEEADKRRAEEGEKTNAPETAASSDGDGEEFAFDVEDWHKKGWLEGDKKVPRSMK